jgi:hypothetical protein
MLLAKPEIGIDLLRLFKLYTKFFYTRSLSFRTNLLDIFKRTFVSNGRLIEYFKAELIRYSVALPSVVFLFNDMFAVMTSVSLMPDRSDLFFESLDLISLQCFVESVLMGHWGDTVVFASRVLVLVKFRSIVQAEHRKDKSILFDSLETGLFLLKPLEPCPAFEAVIRNFDDRLPPLGFLHRIRSEEDAANAWASDRLSTSDLLLRLNGFRGRSFVDLDQYPIFPNVDADDCGSVFPTKAEILSQLASLDPFHFLLNQMRSRSPTNKPERTTSSLPADFYFHPIADGSGASVPIFRREALERDARFVGWVRQAFNFRLPSDRRHARLIFSREPADYAWRVLSAKMTFETSLFLDQDAVLLLPGIQRPLNCIKDLVIALDRPMVGLAIQNYKTNELCHLRTDPRLAFVRNLSVGEFGFYFAADLSIGLSIGFRIEYTAGAITMGQISRFESDGEPFTVVTDRCALCATCAHSTVALWHVWTGAVHRRLIFDSRVTCVMLDAPFMGLLIATVGRICYANLNGDILCECGLSDSQLISTARFVGCPLSEAERCCFCGTTDGEVWAVFPNFGKKRIEIVILGKVHEGEVVALVVHRSKGVMVSGDSGGKLIWWSWPRDRKA